MGRRKHKKRRLIPKSGNLGKQSKQLSPDRIVAVPAGGPSLLDSLTGRLQGTRSQEDVDNVVRAARASALTDEDFKAFCLRVLSRRRQLPERAP